MHINMCRGNVMRVNSITNKVDMNCKKQNVNFESSRIFGYNAFKIETELAKKGVRAEFNNNSFVAESVKKTCLLFEELFKGLKLPEIVDFKSLGKDNKDTYGQHSAFYHEIDINSDNDCFKSKKALSREMQQYRRFFYMPEWLSTSHYLHPFIHEFAHNAHYRNIEKRGNDYAWGWMSVETLPNSIAKLITKFKLSKYANYNIKELMAERITKDICKHLNSEDVFKGNKKNMDYSHVFDNQWNCRYSTPQAYLDYYVQQIWNGDRDGANNAAKQAQTYLAELEQTETIAQTHLSEIERQDYNAEIKQHSLVGIFDAFMGFITPQMTTLDERNQIKPKKHLGF